MPGVKILFVSSEVAPYAKTGGLADVAGALPKALRKLGHDVRIVMPAYRGIRSRFPFTATGLSLQVPVGGFIEHAEIWEGTLAELPVYLIDHPDYFDRDGLYGSAAGDFPDNGERFAFFCHASLELCKRLNFSPNVIHGNDWQCGLLPVFLRHTYRSDPFFAATGTLFTIHNLGYQGHVSPTLLKLFSLPPELDHVDRLEFYGSISLLKGGVNFADVTTTVSDSYCREIQTPEYGHGFDGILRARHNRLFGILNGLDPDDWDPQRLPDAPYSARDLSGKAASKKKLQQELGLEGGESPLIVMVSRLDRQKGFELIDALWEELMAMPVQFALLGSGNRELEERYSARADRFRGRFALATGFNEDLARRFYAGGDLFLMPSLYEPCGLSQLIALRYGTLPLVRSTGGLADTITDPLQDRTHANGFSFEPYSTSALLDTLFRAIALFNDHKGEWQRMMRFAMEQEFTWQIAAHRYLELYRLAQELHRDNRG